MTPAISTLKWAPDSFGRSHFGKSHPVWTSDPSLEALETIARNSCDIPLNEQCQLSFLAQGAFNRVYSVEAREGTYLIRVTLPVKPELKTLSEIATIKFVRTHATDLVPDVVKYEETVRPTENGGLGFEWMVMKKIPGDVLKNVWKQMDWEAKISLVRKLAAILAKLYNKPQRCIGNIYSRDPLHDSFNIEQIVSMAFFWADRLNLDVPHGPFNSSHDWLLAQLKPILYDAATILAKEGHKGEHKGKNKDELLAHPNPTLNDPAAIRAQGEDNEGGCEDGHGDENEPEDERGDEDDESDEEEEFEVVKETKTLAERLEQLLPRIFPPLNDASPEETIIHHDDLSFHNLLADESGKLTGIIDWECVSALPLWYACTLPSFLRGPRRATKPEVDMYLREESGEPGNLYWIHLLEWEKTELRRNFLAEMEILQPKWVHTHRVSKLKYDFYIAIRLCSEEFCQARVARWLDRVEGMTMEGLRGEVGEEYQPLFDHLST